jgi:hypothetical protein
MRTPTDQFRISERQDLDGAFIIEDGDLNELFRVTFASGDRTMAETCLMIKQIGELMIKSHADGVCEGRRQFQREIRALIGAPAVSL